MLAGAIAWDVIRRRPDPLYTMVAAWILCIAPMCMHILILVSLDRGYRVIANSCLESHGRRS
jgi:hypothetical protein